MDTNHGQDVTTGRRGIGVVLDRFVDSAAGQGAFALMFAIVAVATKEPLLFVVDLGMAMALTYGAIRAAIKEVCAKIERK